MIKAVRCRFVIAVMLAGIFAAGCSLDPGSDQEDPPAYPQNIYCACGDGELTLSWDPVPEATAYHIYMAKYSGLSSTNYEEMRTAAASPYTWASLGNDRPYYFVLTSSNSAGEGEHSPAISRMPRDPYTAVDLQRMTGSGTYNYDRFGKAVDIDGDWAVVGAWSDDAGGYTDRGSAFVFHRIGLNSWDEVAKLEPTEPGHNLQFGWSVAVSGDYALIGSPGADGKSGCAYVFRRTGSDSWGAAVKLTAPQPVNDDQFGYCVSISGEYAAVGLIWRTSAYVFQRQSADSWDSGWELIAPEANFGHTLAISGNHVVASSQGAAFVYRRIGLNSWDAGTKLVPPDGGDGFGAPVAIAGDYLVVGAPEQDGGGNDRGAAYVFASTGVGTWDTGVKLVDPNPRDWNRFGSPVAVSGKYVLALSGGDDSAFVFRRDGVGNAWDSGTELTQPAAGGFLGGNAAIDGMYAVIGSSAENTSRGAAYAVYAFPR